MFGIVRFALLHQIGGLSVKAADTYSSHLRLLLFGCDFIIHRGGTLSTGKKQSNFFEKISGFLGKTAQK